MKKIKEFALITLGVLLVSISAEFFLAPNNIAAGGVFGISIIINHFIPMLDKGFLMIIMNVILFIVGFNVIGNKFGVKTIYASLTLSGVIWTFEATLPKNIAITNDPFLATVFGTLLAGTGMAIVFNRNASTGGTDILAKILNKFMHIDIGKSLLAVDFIIAIIATIIFGVNTGMYALLAVIMNGFVIDNVIEGINKCKEVMVISSKYKDISKFIMENLGRGCTIFHGKGGYTGADTYILYCVLGRKEMIRLKNYIKEIDNKAFITVSDAHEVLGEGFKDIISEE